MANTTGFFFLVLLDFYEDLKICVYKSCEKIKLSALLQKDYQTGGEEMMMWLALGASAASQAFISCCLYFRVTSLLAKLMLLPKALHGDPNNAKETDYVIRK